MTALPGARDLPDRDPGLPRFVLVIAAIAAAAAIIAAVRTGAALAPPTLVPQEATAIVGPSGADLFVREGCGECHVTQGVPTALGPSLAGVLASARERLADPRYTGSAATPEAYLREATVDHCRDLLAGYSCPDVSAVELRLGAGEIDRLVRYLAQLEAPP